MRAVTVIAGLGAALCCGACGEITAFCLQAGAPDGVRLEVTTVPTPDGYQLQCGTVAISDTLGVARATADSATAPPSVVRAASLKHAEPLP
jgi:hypothetical protein